MKYANSIKRSILLTVVFSSLVLAITISFVQSYYELERIDKNTRSLIHEQIDLTVKKLDSFRTLDQTAYILRTIFHLKKIEAVNIFDSNCKLLSKMPFNYKMNWDCKKNKLDNVVVYEAKNSISSSEGAPKYILAKIYVREKYFFELVNTEVSLVSALLIVLMTLLLNISIKRKILKPLNSLRVLVGKSGVLTGTQSDLNSFPTELQPIYDNVLMRDEIIQRNKKELIEQNEIKVKNQISQQVAHDIRSPIMILRDFHLKRVEQLHGTNESDIYLDAIKDLDLLTKQLFEQSFEYSNEVNLGSLIETVVKMKDVEFSSIGANVKILTNISNQEDLKVNINPTKFKFILSNILNNAREAMKLNRQCLISIDLELDQESIFLKIEDNGKGLKKTQIKKVFKRGVSVDKPGGSGLGLSDAQAYVNKIGGKISFESDYRKGSVITIRLPRVVSSFQFCGKGPYSEILIEDYKLGQLLWLEEAEKNDLDFAVFSSPVEFLSNISVVAPNATVYLDSHFPDFSQKGEDWAKELSQLGFSKIYMCSTSDIDISDKPWIKGIVSKSHPFQI